MTTAYFRQNYQIFFANHTDIIQTYIQVSQKSGGRLEISSATTSIIHQTGSNQKVKIGKIILV